MCQCGAQDLWSAERPVSTQYSADGEEGTATEPGTEQHFARNRFHSSAEGKEWGVACSMSDSFIFEMCD